MQPLLHCFLIACKDEDDLIKASALSNIAEICKILRFGLHPYITEIIDCVVSMLLYKPSVEVKRGGIYVFFLLLEGLGLDSFQVLPEYLQKVFRLVKFYRTDPDPVTCFHADQAHAYFTEIITEFCSPEEHKSPFHII